MAEGFGFPWAPGFTCWQNILKENSEDEEMVTAAQENTAVHRVIELASHLFSSDSLKDS